MRISLLSPPYVPFYMRNARCDFVSLSGTQWYPVLLGACGAWLEKNGHEIQLIDAPTYHLNKAQAQKLVEDFRPQWLVLYTGRLSETSDLAFGNELCSKIGCECVIVGPYASIEPKRTLAEAGNIKYLIAGEFEHGVAELIAGAEPSKVPNLLYSSDEGIKESVIKGGLSSEELEKMPFVSRFFAHHLDLRRYRALSEPHPFVDLMTGRGCAWGHCTYCLWVHSYKRGASYSFRSIENVIEELSYISKELPFVKSVMLQDDTFPQERAAKFSEAKIKAGITIPWSCYARADFTYETLALMKRAGCLNVHVGFESGCNEILRKIRKGLSVERMAKFAKDAAKAKIRIHGDFAIGFPGETEEDVKSTIDIACKMRPYSAQFQLMIPFPGTPFYDELRERGWLREGLPDYPALSKDRMEYLTRWAYRRFYLSWPYLLQVLTNPRELLFAKLKVYMRALPFMLGGRYIR